MWMRVAGSGLCPLEVVGEGVEDVGLVVDNQCHVRERARVGGGKGFETYDGLMSDLAGVLLDVAEHDAGTHGGEADRLVASVARSREGGDDDRAERSFEVVDHEYDVIELPTVFAMLLGDDRLGVGEGASGVGLPVEHQACCTLDHAIDAAEPHAAGVDRCDERIGFGGGDVSLDEVDGEVAEAKWTSAIHGRSLEDVRLSLPLGVMGRVILTKTRSFVNAVTKACILRGKSGPSLNRFEKNTRKGVFL